MSRMITTLKSIIEKGLYFSACTVLGEDYLAEYEWDEEIEITLKQAIDIGLISNTK